MDIEITQTSTFTVKGECCAVDLRAGTVNGRCALYRNDVYERELAWQEAHPEDVEAILAFVAGCYEARIATTVANVQTLPNEQWGPNEHYMAALMAAAKH